MLLLDVGLYWRRLSLFHVHSCTATNELTQKAHCSPCLEYRAGDNQAQNLVNHDFELLLYVMSEVCQLIQELLIASFWQRGLHTRFKLFLRDFDQTINGAIARETHLKGRNLIWHKQMKNKENKKTRETGKRQGKRETAKTKQIDRWSVQKSDSLEGKRNALVTSNVESKHTPFYYSLCPICCWNVFAVVHFIFVLNKSKCSQ